VADANETPVRVLDRWNKVVGYAPGDDGRVVAVERDGYEPAGAVYARACDLIRHEMADARALVETGRKSPLWYHMVCTHLDLKTLAAYVRLCRFRVWWHMRPGAFARLKPGLLARYARALNVAPEQLRALPERDPEPTLAERAGDEEPDA
jgi:hypothetical protein